MTRQGYGESTGKIILMGEHAVTFGQPAIAIPFNAGKIKVLIESLDEGNYSSITVTYMTECYTMPRTSKSLSLIALLKKWSERTTISKNSN